MYFMIFQFLQKKVLEKILKTNKQTNKKTIKCFQT